MVVTMKIPAIVCAAWLFASYGFCHPPYAQSVSQLAAPAATKKIALKVPITVETDIYFDAMKILDGRAPIEVTEFEDPVAKRDVIEFILVQKAIVLGGLDIEFDVNHGNYDARNLRLLANGTLLVSFDSIWHSQALEIEPHVFISAPVIRKGEYWAGIYTSPTNTSALNIKTLADLRRHSVVSSRAWLTDWSTLSAINPVELLDESNWASMVKLVHLNMVDVMLVSFTKNRPFAYQGPNYKVVAVEGVKIMLNDSRHFIVSRKHPLGEQTFAALERGLKILRNQGAIVKAYTQAGFINDLVADWTPLNAKP